MIEEQDSDDMSRQRIPFWQALTLPALSILAFFFLLEAGLGLLGIRPMTKTEDPFVGFASNIPLFQHDTESAGNQGMVTAPNKLLYFNEQRFSAVKPKGTYRIFSLGGSTTYGRPYDDRTSFSGWLRQFLPSVDRTKEWEVINAGGIGYASYRVAQLMEELVRYSPDLFVIYTGHNEFLEERTYKNIKRIPGFLTSTVGLLARTRTWSAMTAAVQRLNISPGAKNEDRNELASEVVAILDRSAGIDRYTRDDGLRESILEHYRLSLERMVTLAKSVGAGVVFVTPASSLNNCSPFKSEHTGGLTPGERQRSGQLLGIAREAAGQEQWDRALSHLDEAVALDPRHAEVQYRRGQALLAVGRITEAQEALRRARDEDVCPLRALTPMRHIVGEVATAEGVGLVDFVGLLEARMRALKRHPIPGQEFFLDHVHPTIEGNRILAMALVEEMSHQGIVGPSPTWNEGVVASVVAKVEDSVDRETHGQALANLARVLVWAGKREDAARLARQAQEVAGDYRQVATDAASILASVYRDQGLAGESVGLLYEAIARAPGAIELRLKLGETLLSRRFRRLEEAAANLLLVCQQLPDYDLGHLLYGLAMAQRGRIRIAAASLQEALRLNPGNEKAKKALARAHSLLKGQSPSLQPPNILLDLYPSRAPHTLVQMGRQSGGNLVRDGIEVTWHENGRLKQFLDVDLGVPNGLELSWDLNGQLISRVTHKSGRVVGAADSH